MQVTVSPTSVAPPGAVASIFARAAPSACDSASRNAESGTVPPGEEGGGDGGAGWGLGLLVEVVDSCGGGAALARFSVFRVFFSVFRVFFGRGQAVATCSVTETGRKVAIACCRVLGADDRPGPSSWPLDRVGKPCPANHPFCIGE